MQYDNSHMVQDSDYNVSIAEGVWGSLLPSCGATLKMSAGRFKPTTDVTEAPNITSLS